MPTNHTNQTKMPVTEYARKRNLQAQLVYYYIRTGKLPDEDCICGRRVVDVKAADEFFRELSRKKAKS